MFEKNILFVNVSKTPNVKVIVQNFFFFFRNKQNLFNYKDMQPKFQIEKDEDAINQLSQLLNHITPNPILLILDDVWLGSEPFLPEKFKFDLPNYKILVTSRTAFPRFEFTYHLKLLELYLKSNNSRETNITHLSINNCIMCICNKNQQ